MLNIKDVVNRNPEIMSGELVFKGTRVPAMSLIRHLEKGITLDEFLEDFPTVTREQAIAFLEIVGSNASSLYESAA